MKGPANIPRFPKKAKKLNALACVVGVLFSVIIVRIVLGGKSQNQQDDCAATTRLTR